MVHPAHSRDRFGGRSDRRTRRPASRRRRTPPGPWKHGPLPVIGIIGGIGAGKSLAAQAFARRGALVLDADAIGHRLLEQPPSRQRVLDRFGPEILTATGPGDAEAPPPIDRRALAARVFDDPAALRDLEAILHPRMRSTFEKAIARAARKGQHTAVVLDAAVLLEAGWDDLSDLIVFVDAPRDLRLARLASARGWTAEMLAQREAAQLPLDLKRQRADVVIANRGEPDRVDAAVGQLWARRIESVQRIERS